MEIIKGNLLDMADNGEFDIIVHGCNCFHAMGGGIARQIAIRFPDAEAADLGTEYGSKKKLSTFSYAHIEGKSGKEFVLVNAYTQHKWSGVKDVFEYKSFDIFLNRLCGFSYSISERTGERVKIGFPKIGCGLAKGKEEKIMLSLSSFAESAKDWATVTVVYL